MKTHGERNYEPERRLNFFEEQTEAIRKIIGKGSPFSAERYIAARKAGEPLLDSLYAAGILEGKKANG